MRRARTIKRRGGGGVRTCAAVTVLLLPLLLVLDGRGMLAAQGRARNAVLIVGDGMSDGLITAMRLLTVGAAGTLAMDALPATAQMTTHSADSLVTDSAASATAMAIGFKTKNGAVGVDAQGRPGATVLELAQRAGKWTGVITTATVVDATPASFTAHVRSREEKGEIARQLLELGPRVILGGGETFFRPGGTVGQHPQAGDRRDGRDLLAEAHRRGYTSVFDEAGLRAVDAANVTKLLGLFSEGDMFVAEPEPGGLYNPRPSLATMVEKGLTILEQAPLGFFLVVEDEGTDELCHRNNAELCLKAAQGLDEAVAVIVDFARRASGTLVILVGDHETGGVGVTSPHSEDGQLVCRERNGAPSDGPLFTPDRLAFCVSWATTGHTGDQVRIAALGPGQELVGRRLDNTAIFHILTAAMGLLPSGR
ncbi:MAG: alkaline phosphatase [Candidatus Methylomirabilia bacterium]